MGRKPASAFLAVGAVALLATGCGRDGAVSLSTNGATAARFDRAAAERVVLRPADLPGYEVGEVLAGSAADAASQHAASSFESCAGAAGALGGDDRAARSPGFFKGRIAMVSSLAVVTQGEAEARRAMADLSRGELDRCVTALFRTVLGLELLPGTTARTEVLPADKVADRLADQSVTWRTTIHVSSPGGTVPAYSDLTFVRSGRTLGVLLAFQIGEPFPTGDRTRLVEAMAGRMAASS